MIDGINGLAELLEAVPHSVRGPQTRHLQIFYFYYSNSQAVLAAVRRAMKKRMVAFEVIMTMRIMNDEYGRVRSEHYAPMTSGIALLFCISKA